MSTTSLLSEKTKALARQLVDLDRFVKGLSSDEVLSVLDTLGRTEELGTLVQSMIINLGIRISNADLLHIAGSRVDEIGPALSFLSYPVGMRSQDGSAILGRNGFIFLIGGSNDVLSQYRDDCKDCETHLEAWIALLRARYEEAKLRHIHLHHIIVPEKISLLREFYPFPIRTPTGLLDGLESAIASGPYARTYVSARAALHQFEGSVLCRRSDSHLSPFGSYQLFRAIMRSIFCYQVPLFNFKKPAYSLGDLTFRMSGMFVADDFFEASTEDLPYFVHAATRIEDILPSDGTHRGRRQVWQNSKAPVQAKMVVFGNSFFSSAENGQCTLSWWMSRWITEFHFVWTNEVDWDYVDSVQPNIVLWQGIERFLPVVPQT